MKGLLLSLMMLTSSVFSQQDTAISRAEETVVKVLSLTMFGGSQGSGVFIGPGTILTASHVVGPAQRLFVYYDKTAELLPAVLVLNNKRYDFAIIKIKNLQNDSAIFTNSFRVGQPVFSFGMSKDGDFTFSKGILNGVSVINNYDGTLRKVIRIDSTNILPGFSGTPIFNYEGQVLGILQLCRIPENREVHPCFAIQSSEINEQLNGRK